MCWACWSTMEMGFVDRPFVFEATLEHFHHPRHNYHHLLHNPPQTWSYYMLLICQTSGLVWEVEIPIVFKRPRKPKPKQNIGHWVWDCERWGLYIPQIGNDHCWKGRLWRLWGWMTASLGGTIRRALLAGSRSTTSDFGLISQAGFPSLSSSSKQLVLNVCLACSPSSSSSPS